MLSDGPGVYAFNVECVWLVEAPGPITVVFTHFHTLADYDFLEIFDGTGDDAGLLASASGPALPEPLFSNSTSVKIVFTSTGYITFSGFELELFALVPGGTWFPTGVPTAAPTWASESGAILCFVPCLLPHEHMRLPQCRWPFPRTVRVAAAPDGVLFQCDPAAERCAPDGTYAWRCSSDCIYDECEINLRGYGLRGRCPELGDLRCAQRITYMFVGPALGSKPLCLPPSVSTDSVCQNADGQPWLHRSASRQLREARAPDLPVPCLNRTFPFRAEYDRTGRLACSSENPCPSCIMDPRSPPRRLCPMDALTETDTTVVKQWTRPMHRSLMNTGITALPDSFNWENLQFLCAHSLRATAAAV